MTLPESESGIFVGFKVINFLCGLSQKLFETLFETFQKNPLFVSKKILNH